MKLSSLPSLLITPLLFSHSTVHALNCDKGDLNLYKLQEVFSSVAARTIISDTPPSKTNMTWFFNLCNEVESVHPDCPKHSQICGVQTVLLPGEEPIKTQVISYGNGLNYEVTLANKTDLEITLDETSWGSNSIGASLQLHCSSDTDNEDISVEWDQQSQLVLHWNTQAACLKSSKSNPPKDGDKNKDKDPSKKPVEDESWGWFTWFFIIFVLVVGGYIILGAWVTYTKSPADLQDAVHDFGDTLKNLFGALPGFIAEIIQKVFGSNSSRGGYSAV